MVQSPRHETVAGQEGIDSLFCSPGSTPEAAQSGPCNTHSGSRFTYEEEELEGKFELPTPEPFSSSSEEVRHVARSAKLTHLYLALTYLSKASKNGTRDPLTLSGRIRYTLEDVLSLWSWQT